MTTGSIIKEAAQWVVRQQGDAIDWDAFTTWLEADSRHRTAYDELACINRDLEDHSAAIVASLPDTPQPRPANDARTLRWKLWGGGGVAAALLVVGLALQPFGPRDAVQEFRSSPGKSTEVALAGGAKVILAPASRLTVTGPSVALEGTGYFDVPHMPGRHLTIAAGAIEVTDIGTRFSLANEPEGISVDVAEGSLSVRSNRLTAPIALTAGRGLRVDVGDWTVGVVSVDPQRVAGWRTGKLQFDEAPLSLVARDISRYSGKRVTVDQAIADQPFSGVIAINDGQPAAQTLAQILSLDARQVDGGLRLEPRRR